MKKFLATVVCAMVVLTASAQRANSGVSFKGKAKDVAGSVQFGIRAGMNVSNRNYSYDGKYDWYEDGKDKALVGYNLGVVVDIPVFKRYLYIQPGLYFTQKGYKYKESDYDRWEGYDYKEKANPVYLEIPILISGRYDITNSVQLQVNFGPYIAVGLGGKLKGTESWYDDDYSGKDELLKGKFFGKFDSKDWEKWDDDSPYKEGVGYKRFDAGLSLGAGVLLKQHYFIGFQYEFGLVDTFSDDNWLIYEEDIKPDKISQKNRNFMLTVGYNF